MKSAVLALIVSSVALAEEPPPPPVMCPVEIVSLNSSSGGKAGLMAALVMAGSSSTYLVLKYRNQSKATITGIRFSVEYFNSVGEVGSSGDITTPTIKLKPGASSSLVQADGHITGGHKIQTAGWVARVMFSDGTTWDDGGSRRCAAR